MTRFNPQQSHPVQCVHVLWVFAQYGFETQFGLFELALKLKRSAFRYFFGLLFCGGHAEGLKPEDDDTRSSDRKYSQHGMDQSTRIQDASSQETFMVFKSLMRCNLVSFAHPSANKTAGIGADHTDLAGPDDGTGASGISILDIQKLPNS